MAVFAKRKLSDHSDEQLADEIEALRQQRRAFANEHNGKIREDVHAGIDKRLGEARAIVEGMLAAKAGELGRLSLEPAYEGDVRNLVATHALFSLANDAGFAKGLHDAVDAAPAGTFAELTRAQYDAELARFTDEIAAREAELARRPIEARRAELEAELKALAENHAP